MSGRGGLGRGLESLLDGGGSEVAPVAPDIAIDRLHPSPHQPRSRMREEALEELARSIRAQGVIEPVIVRPREAGGYEIIAGERRWRAAQRAGLTAVPAIVREVDDRQAMAMALIENIQREDLNPLEEARALRRLVDEFALTHEALAEAVGKSRTGVTNLLRLLNLAPGARALLDEGVLEMGHARALLTLPAAQQGATARRVAEGGLSVRQTEALVRRLRRGQRPPPPENPDTRRYERALGDRLGARVAIADRGGKGRIVIRYGSLDELDGLLRAMGAKPGD